MNIFGRRSKEVKEDFGGYNADSELDFYNDVSDISSQASPDIRKASSRNPVVKVFKGAVSGAKGKAVSVSFVRDKVLKALPQEAAMVQANVDQVTSSVRKLYEDSTRELRPHVKALSGKIDKLVPEEARIIKKITSKASRFFGNEELGYRGMSKEETQNNAVASSIAEIFATQMAQDNTLRAQDRAKEQVKENIDRHRHEETVGLQATAANAMAKVAMYTETVNMAWQKKMMELSMRQLFVQTEIAENLTRYNEIFKTQNEGILKNTALPEFVKIKESERFREAAKNRFYNELVDNSVGGVIKTGFARIGQKAREKVQMATMALEMATQVADMYEMHKSTEDVVAGLEGMGGDAPASGGGGFLGFVSSLLGGAAVDFVGSKAAETVKEMVDKNPKTANFVMRMINFARDPVSTIKDVLNSDRATELEARNDSVSWGIKQGKALMGFFGLDTPNVQLDTRKSDVHALRDPADFDNRTYRTINEIIPGYLARQLREAQIGNMLFSDYADLSTRRFSKTSNQAGDRFITAYTQGATSPLTVYDFKKDGWSSEADVIRNIENELLDASSSAGVTTALKSLTTQLFTEGQFNNMSEAEQTEILNALLNRLLFEKDLSTSSKALSDKDAFSAYGISESTRLKLQAAFDFHNKSESAIENAKLQDTISLLRGTNLPIQNVLKKAQDEYNMYGTTVGASELLQRTSDGGIAANTDAILKKLFSDAGAYDESRGLTRRGNMTFTNHAQEAQRKEFTSLFTKPRLILNSPSLNIKLRDKAKEELARIEEWEKLPAEDKKLLLKAAKEIYGKKPPSTIDNIVAANDAIQKTYDRAKQILQEREGPSDVRIKKDIKPLKGSVLASYQMMPDMKSWKYKPGMGTGDDQTRIGPMAQDVHRILGKEASQDGTSIDLITLNGMNMQAIKELDTKVSLLTGQDDQGPLMHAVRHLKRLEAYSRLSTSYLRDLVKLGALTATSTTSTAAAAQSTSTLTAAKSLPQALSNLGLSTIDVGKHGVSAAFNAATSAYTFLKDKALLPVLGFAKDMFNKYKDPVIAKVSELLYMGLSGGMKVAGTAKDFILGAGQTAINGVRSGYNWIRSKTENIYFDKEKTRLALDAMVMKAGGYYDAVSGAVIRRASDIKGDVKDASGRIVLKVSDWAHSGLWDSSGKRVSYEASRAWAMGKAGVKGAASAGGSALKTIWNFATGKNTAGEALYSLVGGGATLVGKTVRAIFGGFGSGKYAGPTYNVLLDIRDILRVNLTKRPKRLRSYKEEQAIAKDKETTSSSTAEIKKTIKDSARALTQEAKNTASTAPEAVIQKVKAAKNAFQNYQAPEDTGASVQKVIDKTRAKIDTLVDNENTRREMVKRAEGYRILTTTKPDGGKTQLGLEFKYKDKVVMVFKNGESKLSTFNNPAWNTDEAALGRAKKLALKWMGDHQKREELPKAGSESAKGFFGRIGDAAGQVSSGVSSVKQMFGRLLDNEASRKAMVKKAEAFRVLKAGALGHIGLEFKYKEHTVAVYRTGQTKLTNSNETQWNTDEAALGRAKKLADKWMSEASARAQTQVAAAAKPADTQAASAAQGPSLFSRVLGFFDRKKDKDGDGDVDGSHQDLESSRAKARKDREAGQVIKKSDKAKVNEANSHAGLLSTIFSGISSLIGTAFGGLTKLFGGTAGKVMTAIASRLGVTAIVGGAKAAAATAAAVATSLPVKAALVAGGSVLGGPIGAVLAGPALLSMLLNPVTLGVAVVGTAAYFGFGAWKKAMVDQEFINLRFAQYGFTKNGQDEKYHGRLEDLEAYLFEGFIVKGPSGLPELKNTLDPKKILEILGTDQTSPYEVNRVIRWFHRRFKPFFLTHVAALWKFNCKNYSDVRKLPVEKFKRFVETITFPGGPYDQDTSPFVKKPRCENTKTHVQYLAQALIAQHEKRNSGDDYEGYQSAKEAEKKAKKLADLSAGAAQTEGLTTEEKRTLAGVNSEQRRLASIQRDRDALMKRHYAQVDKTLLMEGEDGEEAPTFYSKEDSITGRVPSLKKAKGPLVSGESGLSYIKLGPKANLQGLHPVVKRAFLGMAQEYGQATGRFIYVDNAYRSFEEQARLKQSLGKKAAAPGRSMHNFGLALDISSKDAAILEELGLMRKYGFTRPVGTEPWHIEMAGIQPHISAIIEGRMEASALTRALESSFGRGGGGVGSMPEVKRLCRNAAIAKASFDAGSFMSGITGGPKEFDVDLKEASKNEKVVKGFDDRYKTVHGHAGNVDRVIRPGDQTSPKKDNSPLGSLNAKPSAAGTPSVIRKDPGDYFASRTPSVVTPEVIRQAEKAEQDRLTRDAAQLTSSGGFMKMSDTSARVNPYSPLETFETIRDVLVDSRDIHSQTLEVTQKLYEATLALLEQSNPDRANELKKGFKTNVAPRQQSRAAPPASAAPAPSAVREPMRTAQAFEEPISMSRQMA